MFDTSQRWMFFGDDRRVMFGKGFCFAYVKDTRVKAVERHAGRCHHGNEPVVGSCLADHLDGFVMYSYKGSCVL